MADPFAELDQDAQARKRGSRNPGSSRNPRKLPTPEEVQRQRDEERARREADRRSPEPAPQPEPEPAQAPQPDAAPASPGRGRKTRSIPFYPDPDNEDFLWRVAEAATARREKIPAVAVLRFAMRRLEQQMTPSEIVQALGGPVQTKGKMGRPRR